MLTIRMIALNAYDAILDQNENRSRSLFNVIEPQLIKLYTDWDTQNPNSLL